MKTHQRRSLWFLWPAWLAATITMVVLILMAMVPAKPAERILADRTWKERSGCTRHRIAWIPDCMRSNHWAPPGYCYSDEIGKPVYRDRVACPHWAK